MNDRLKNKASKYFIDEVSKIMDKSGANDKIFSDTLLYGQTDNKKIYKMILNYIKKEQSK